MTNNKFTFSTPMPWRFYLWYFCSDYR